MNIRTILTVVFIWVVAQNLYSQWEVSYFKISHNFVALAYVADDHFMSITNDGFIYRENGTSPYNITITHSGISPNINDMHFPNDYIGWIVSDDGNIYKTTDAGLTWNSQNSGTSQNLNSIFFINTNEGIAVGNSGTILKTTDGGSTWADKSISGFTDNINRVHFGSSSGWIISQNADVYLTTDFGESWTDISPLGLSEELTGVFVFDTDDGFIAGDNGTLYYRSSGGTWENRNSSISTNEDIKFIYFYTADDGYLGGTNGFLAETDNSGDTWSTDTDIEESDETILAIAYDGASDFLFMGTNALYYDFSAMVVYSLMFPVMGISFVDDNTGWVVGSSGAILKTTDAGTNWKFQVSSMDEYINSVYFIDVNSGYAVSDDGYILKTTNSGINWSVSNPTSEDLNAVYFLSSSTGYAVGSNGVILKTTNSGSSWSESNAGSENLKSVHFYNLNYVLTVGENNSIYFTTNGGANWTAGTPITGTLDYESVFMVSESLAYSVADLSVAKTTDNGASWTKIFPLNAESFTTNPLKIGFINQDIGFIGGIGGFYRTTNGGDLWSYLDDYDSQWEIPLALSIVYDFATSSNYLFGAPTDFFGTVYFMKRFIGPELPTVQTLSIGSIGENTAIASGNIIFNGGSTITASGFVWSRSGNPTVEDNEGMSNNPIQQGNFNYNMTGLLPGKLYFVRAYATNSIGTAYGNQRTFTTIPLPLWAKLMLGSLFILAGLWGIKRMFGNFS